MHRVGKYIGDLVYGANDGIITTFAVVAGVAGASLSPTIVVILGISNLLADGFSMAASNYLARKSEKEYLITQGTQTEETKNPLRNASATFLAFVVAGSIPLLPYVFGIKGDMFLQAIIATSVILFVVGSLRARITGINWFRAGMEMLAIGALAAFVAYIIGKILGNLI